MGRRSVISSALGRSGHEARSDLDGLPAVVPPAVAAHHVRELGGATARAHTARRPVQRPGRGPAAAALGLRRLLLGNGHRGLSWVRGADAPELPERADETAYRE